MAAIWVQIQWLEWDNPNTYPIYKLLDQEEELVRQKQIWNRVITIKDGNLKHGCY